MMVISGGKGTKKRWQKNPDANSIGIFYGQICGEDGFLYLREITSWYAGDDFLVCGR